MNTLTQTQYILVVVILMLSITQVVNIRGYNETEADLCKTLIPRTDNECKSSFNFKTITCCIVKMKRPFIGNICMPMGVAAIGTKGEFNRELPENIRIIGDFTCFSQYVKLDFAMFYLFFIIIFINLF
jgi:hypothetical protein